MWPDPNPNEVGLVLDCERTVMTANSHRPQLANFLEVQRRVCEIFFQEVEVVSGHSLDSFW